MTVPVRQWIAKMQAASDRADAEELLRLRALTQEQRVAELQAISRATLVTLQAMRPELREKALAWRDPLPPSTEAALKRLRERARSRG